MIRDIIVYAFILAVMALAASEQPSRQNDFLANLEARME